MKQLGLEASDFSGHSLRAGFVTDSITNGIQSIVIRKVTGHTSDSMLSEYYRDNDVGLDVVKKLGL